MVEAAQPKYPVYVLHGGDQFLLDSWRKQIVEHLLEGGDPQVCVSSFDAAAPLAEVFDELRTLPFLAPHRIVILRDADAFIATHRSAVEKYLASPCASSSLVLMLGSFPRTTRLYKLVEKVGQICDCTAPDRSKIGAWLGRRASGQGKTIDRQASELLVHWVGEDLAALNSEMDKLISYVGERRAISLEDVSAVVTATTGPAAFDLTNAVTLGEAPAAIRALGGMLTTRGEEFKTLGMLAWHLRRALKASQQIDAGLPPAKAIPPMPPAQRSAFEKMLRRRGVEQFQKDFRNLIRADLAMKSGTSPATALQDLVLSLCS